MPRQPRPHFQIPFHHHHHHYHHYHYLYLLIKEGNSNISLATALHWMTGPRHLQGTDKQIKKFPMCHSFFFSLFLYLTNFRHVFRSTHTHKFHIWNSFPSFFFFFLFSNLVGPWIVVVAVISQVVILAVETQ